MNYRQPILPTPLRDGNPSHDVLHRLEGVWLHNEMYLEQLEKAESIQILGQLCTRGGKESYTNTRTAKFLTFEMERFINEKGNKRARK